MVFALCCGDVGVPLQGAWAGCCLLWMAVQGAAARFFSEAAGCVACGEWYAILFKFRGHRICIANAGQVACHIHRRKKNINPGMLVCIMSVCANRIRANRCEGARTGANRCEPVRIGTNRCESVRTGANRCEPVRIGAHQIYEARTMLQWQTAHCHKKILSSELPNTKFTETCGYG